MADVARLSATANSDPFLSAIATLTSASVTLTLFVTLS